MVHQEFLTNLDYFLLWFLNIIKVYLFLYRLIILLHWVSPFSLDNVLLVLYAYIFIESIDCTLLSAFEFKTTLFFSLVKPLCLSLLNLWCVFNITRLLFIDYKCYLHQFHLLMIYFIFKLSCFWTSFITFKFKFYFHYAIFAPFIFLCSLPSSVK